MDSTVSIDLVLVVAVADNGVIGQGNAMPWRLKSDLQRFKQLTLNKPVIMGRKTYQSIGRPLPGRTNVVVTRDPAFAAAGVVVAPSFEAAEQVARGDALRRFATEIAVIGGADIFAHWLPRAARLELTEVHARPEGDTYFPAIDPELWEEVARERRVAGPQDSSDFSYVTYRRCAATEAGRGPVGN
ncbi:dihydrofolate reductase [Rubrivivax sp. JA1024]|nr:dihydrofolate reductase [Rubrivivax sp. JA1024]